MHRTPHIRSLPKHSQRTQRGFTLVELMVAVTGGLFMSIMVFVLARDGARFYERESRVADATFGSMVGFERLRVDIERAGFLSSPNVRQDPKVCGNPAAGGSWPALYSRLASLRIEDGPALPPNLAANGLAPDRITIAGSMASTDQFPIRTVVETPTGYQAFLQVNSGAMARLGYIAASGDEANQTALLQRVFQPNRGLRITDHVGGQHFGTITGVQGGNQPYVSLSNTPTLNFKQTNAMCGIRALGTGTQANVINFVRYDIRNLAGDPNYAGLYSAGSREPFNPQRTELTRVELDTTGNVIAGTQELITEYAVDLKFGAVVASVGPNGEPSLSSIPIGAGPLSSWVGPDAVLAPARGPQRVRTLRTRLSVRSREADREGPVTATATVAPGLYRVGLGPNGVAPFARVRTIQADIALRNQLKALW